MRWIICASMAALGGCAAADGQWPSLQTAQEKMAGKAGATPVLPVAVLPQNPVVPDPAPAASLPVPDQPGARLAPAVTRLQQEAREVAFILERQAQHKAALDAARTAAAGKPARSPEVTALRLEERRGAQLLADLADSRDTCRRLAGDLAVAAAAGEPVAKPLNEAGALLARLAALLEKNQPALQPAQISSQISKADLDLQRLEKSWQAQAGALRARAAAARKAGPEDDNWNSAQTGLTRINQSGWQFGQVRTGLEKIAGDLAELSASGGDVTTLLTQVGTLLARTDARIRENDTLVSDTRKLLERL